MVSREEVTSLLQIQREAYNDSINHLTAGFNSQFEGLKEELNAVKQDLVSTKRELDSKQTQVVELTSKIEDLETAIESYKTDPVTIFNRLDSLEDHSRRNNLRIDGVSENPNENWEHTAVHVEKLAEKIGFDHNVTIDRAHRVGNKDNGGRPRTIIVKFHYFRDREFFLRNSYKLKGTSVFVNEDLCQSSLEKRKEQLPRLQQARRDGKTAYFSHTKLIIKEKSRNENFLNANNSAAASPASDLSSSLPLFSSASSTSYSTALTTSVPVTSKNATLSTTNTTVSTTSAAASVTSVKNKTITKAEPTRKSGREKK